MPRSKSRAKDLFECDICHKPFTQEWVNNHNCQRSVQRVEPPDKDRLSSSREGLASPKERHSSPERHPSLKDRHSSEDRLSSPKDRHGSQDTHHGHSSQVRHYSPDDRHFSQGRHSSQDRHSSPGDRHFSQDRHSSVSPGSKTAKTRTSHVNFPKVTCHPSIKTKTAIEPAVPSNSQLPQHQRVKLLTDVRNLPQSASSDRNNQCQPLPEATCRPSMRTDTAAEQSGSFNKQLPPNRRTKSSAEVKSSLQTASFNCNNERVQSQTDKVTSPPSPNVTYHHLIETKTAAELAQLRQNQRVRPLAETKHSLQATRSDCKNRRVRSPTEVKNSPQSVTSSADEWGRLKTRTARTPVIRQSASIGKDEDEDGDDEDVDGHPTKPLQDKYLDTASLTRKAKEVIYAAGIDWSSREPETLLNEFVRKDVRLQQTDMSAVNGATHALKARLLEKLKQETDWEWDCLNTGSHYDGTKVTRADELDIMFFPKIPETWLEIVCDRGKFPAEYCFLRLKKATEGSMTSCEYKKLKELCYDSQRPDMISSQMFREKIHGVLKKAIDERERRAKVCDTGSGSPSFCIKLLAIPCSEGTGLKPIDIDLVPSMKLRRWPEKSTMEKVKNEDLKKEVKSGGFAVIPKEYKKDNEDDEDEYKHVKHLLWRLSFSSAEKELTKGGPVCWKTVTRVLKRSLELMQGLQNQKSGTNPPEAKLKLVKAASILQEDFRRRNSGFAEWKFKFKTYQIRTLMWTQLYMLTTERSLWVESRKMHRLSQSLTHLLKMLSGRTHVPHFFIPDFDIMADVPREEREFLYVMFVVVKRLFCPAEGS